MGTRASAARRCRLAAALCVAVTPARRRVRFGRAGADDGFPAGCPMRRATSRSRWRWTASRSRAQTPECPTASSSATPRGRSSWRSIATYAATPFASHPAAAEGEPAVAAARNRGGRGRRHHVLCGRRGHRRSGRSVTLTFDFAPAAASTRAATPRWRTDGSGGVAARTLARARDVAARARCLMRPPRCRSPDVAVDVAPDRPDMGPLVDAPVDMPDRTRPPTCPTRCWTRRRPTRRRRSPPTAWSGGLLTASVSTASGSPTLAVSANGLFSVAWLGPSGTSVLYNAVDAADMLQNAADVAVVPAASGVTFATPRLANVGPDLMLAYGRTRQRRARRGHPHRGARRRDPGRRDPGRQLHPGHRAARRRRRRRQRRRIACRGHQPARRAGRPRRRRTSICSAARRGSSRRARRCCCR